MNILLLRSDSQKADPVEIPKVNNGFFESFDGHQVYFEDTGGRGPVLFYIYGLGCSIKHWKYCREYLGTPPRLYRQVYIDLRGHGQTAPQPGNSKLTFATLIEDIFTFCQLNKIRQAHFLGQSFGGTIAMMLAERQPELVASIVALASPAKDPGEDLPGGKLGQLALYSLINLNKTSRLGMRLLYKPLPYMEPLMQEIIRFTGFNPQLSKRDDVVEYVGELLKVSPNTFYDLAEELKTTDVTLLAPKIRAPVLIIAGARDQLISLKQTRQLAKAVPHCELEVVKHGSHCPHMDDPGKVNRRIERFLKLHG